MTRLTSYLLFVFLLFASLSLVAQDDEVFPTINEAASPGTYPASTMPESEAAKYWDASFPEQTVGFFHVYADPAVDAAEVYLLRGEELDGLGAKMLPKKFQRIARRMEADVYASAAIRGINENLYLVRMDGPSEDRIEMFALRGDEVKHLRTLARYKKYNSGKVLQMDSYITDIDGDTNLDLVTIKRKRNGKVKRNTYVMNNDREWSRATTLDTPWDSIDFFDPKLDDE